jgi:hypothetical protein
MRLDRRLATVLAASALVGFAACGDEEDEGAPTPNDVQQQIDEGQRQLEEGQQQAEDALQDAQDAIDDPAGEAQEQLEQEAQEQLQGEQGE